MGFTSKGQGVEGLGEGETRLKLDRILDYFTKIREIGQLLNKAIQ